MEPRVFVPGIFGAKTAKEAAVRYRPAVTPPTAAWISRPVADADAGARAPEPDPLAEEGGLD